MGEKSLRTLSKGVSLSDKTVLLRVDADTPVERGRVKEGTHGRLAKAAVMVEWLRQRGARVVVLGHRGRPEGKRVPSLSLAPAAKRLSELLGTTIPLLHDVVGSKVEARVSRMMSGDMLMLENVRFHPGETKDDASLARSWGKLGDLYVDDAFASVHRAHASIHALSRELPAYAGLQLAHEVQLLREVQERPSESFVVVLGGAKIHTKIGTLKVFLKKKATVCIGGALAHPFLLAQGHAIGSSLVEKEDIPFAKQILRSGGSRILLPVDVVVVLALRKGAASRVVAVEDVGSKDKIVDIGPRSVERILLEVSSAKTIVWNGPLGVCERKEFCKGTQQVARAIVARRGKAMTIVGGGDTVPVVESFHLSDGFTLVSTGGGAMMALLAGEKLPGLEYLFEKK